MGISLNHDTLARAKSAASDGNTTDTEWSAPVGSERKKNECLGIDHDEPDGSAESLKYPIFSGGKLNWNAVHDAESRATQNGLSDIANACKELYALRKDKKVAKFSREFHGQTAFPAIDDAAPSTTFLMLGGSDEPALTLSSSFPYPKSVKGQPCEYRWKEVLKVGSWPDANGIRQTIDPARIDQVHASFQMQKAKGILPFIPPNHKERSGDRNLGYIVDARKSPTGSLEFLHQLIGNDAHLAAARNGTSICTYKNVKLADGTVVPEFVDHNAILPDPAITDLKDFEPALAASRGHGDAVILISASQRSDDMKLSKEHRDRLAKVLPDAMASKIPDEPDNEYWVKLLESRADEHKTAMSRVEKERDDANSGLQLARQGQPKAIDPEVLVERRKRLSASIDHTLATKLSKPCLDAVREYVLGTDTAPNMMMLSRENPDNIASPIRAEKLIEILGSNTTPPPQGVQSGIQMSRQTPGAQDTEAQKAQEKAWEDEGKAARDAEFRARGMEPPK